MTKTRLKPCRKESYALLKDTHGDETSITLEQNLEAPGGDRYRVEMELCRWRTKAELVAYLRQVADVIEAGS